jgi:hypothetical protein
MLKPLLVALLLTTSAMALHEAEININEKDLEVQLLLDIAQFNETMTPDATFIGATYINSNQSHNDYGKDAELYEIDFLLRNYVPSISGLLFGIGMKLDYTNSYPGQQFLALPLGVEAAYLLPDSPLPLYLSGALYYAPEVLSFQDAQNFFEYVISLDMEIISNGFITAGYRNIDTKYKTYGNQTLNASWFVGLRVDF